jgi:hypothetical protein
MSGVVALLGIATPLLSDKRIHRITSDLIKAGLAVHFRRGPKRE